jgi:AcrR family transcriptional regulator
VARTTTAAEIVADMRAMIIAGRLRPGEMYPSAKDIMYEWEVPMAAAYKAMVLLRQEGLAAKVVRGWGIVVTGDAPDVAAAWRPPPPPTSQRRAQVLNAAIELADADGLAAMSMRRIGERLGLRIMTVYKYVRDRAELVIVMADTVFAEHPPPPVPTGTWRAQLELLCRTQWQMYRRHRWLAEAVSFQRPQLCPHVAAHLAWAMRALEERGLAEPARAQLAATAAYFVRGSAMHADRRPEARATKGRKAEARKEARQDAALFEFGLQRLLDGFELVTP